VEPNIETRSYEQCKNKYITYYGCVFVALGAQHAMRMRRSRLSPVRLYHIFSPTLSHKRHDFREKVTEHKMCALIFCTILSETFLILRRSKRDMIKNVYRSACKVPVILVRESSCSMRTDRQS
jgi:hypothetical protein